MRALLVLTAVCAVACTGKTRTDEEKPRPTAAAPEAAPKFDATPLKADATRPPPPKKPTVAAPPDVATAPADAEKTASGLASKVLTPGTGRVKPHEWDEVEVHYTGWTADGKMFGTTAGRPKPAKFSLFQVIPGWTEGVQLMVEGEKRRFWIPVDLAYGGRSGAPAGDLTFDIELLKINEKLEPPAPPADLQKVPGGKKTKSGTTVQVKEHGSGKKPALADAVEMEYTGWIAKTGKLFDSTHVNGEPATSQMKRLPPGWQEGLMAMKEGERAVLWIPEKAAFAGRPGAPEGDLVLDVKLISVKEAPKPPPVPRNLAKPPADAKKTDSGIAYKVLTKGKGTVHPTADSKVSVHYAGWTTDGKMFDSSIPKGKPSSFPLGRVIKGWTEGVQLMVVGDKMRFWIPEELAYQGKPGKPAGMLVFEIELLEIDG